MIDPEKLYGFLKEKGVSFFSGVPDSLLKYFLKYLQDHSESDSHIITANEGLAIGLASGYHFATGKLPLVYLQNSGLGNIINPVTSLADAEMYSVPLLLMIGWRGRPGHQDEPQHTKMGKITVSVLDVLGIPNFILESDEQTSFNNISLAIKEAVVNQKPVAILVPEGIFEQYNGKKEIDNYSLLREGVIKNLLSHLNGNEIVVCTTGKIGREFYEQNIAAGTKINKYMLSAGAMGHANHIALGLKLASDEKVIILDGDGAILMHMGSLPVIAHLAENNFIHIVLNNGSHESVGGQPTEGFFADFSAIAASSGYNNVLSISSEEELAHWLTNGLNESKTQFVEIKTSRVSRNDLIRPAGSPLQWKENLMSAIKQKK